MQERIRSLRRQRWTIFSLVRWSLSSRDNLPIFRASKSQRLSVSPEFSWLAPTPSKSSSALDTMSTITMKIPNSLRTHLKSHLSTVSPVISWLRSLALPSSRFSGERTQCNNNRWLEVSAWAWWTRISSSNSRRVAYSLAHSSRTVTTWWALQICRQLPASLEAAVVLNDHLTCLVLEYFF